MPSAGELLRACEGPKAVRLGCELRCHHSILVLSKQACRHTLEDIDSQKVEYIQLDLMDKPAVQKKLRRQQVNDVTYVFHLAFHGELPGCTLISSTAK